MKKIGIIIFSLAILQFGCTSTESGKTPTTPQSKKAQSPADKAYVIAGTPDSEVKRHVVDGTEVELKELSTENDIKYHNGKPFNGYAISKMSSGKPFTLNGYKNGIKDGYYATWYGNGKIQQEGFYKQGKQDGINLEYYDNGTKQREHHWIMGKKNGAWLSWYENGGKWSHRDFKNDNIHGKIYVWDEEGILGKEYFYSNGALTNKIMHFENNEGN